MRVAVNTLVTKPNFKPRGCGYRRGIFQRGLAKEQRLWGICPRRSTATERPGTLGSAARRPEPPIAAHAVSLVRFFTRACWQARGTSHKAQPRVRSAGWLNRDGLKRLWSGSCIFLWLRCRPRKDLTRLYMRHNLASLRHDLQVSEQKRATNDARNHAMPSCKTLITQIRAVRYAQRIGLFPAARPEPDARA